MPDQDTMRTSIMPSESMSKCSTITRTSSESSIRKEKIKYVPEPGMKWKRGDQLDLELPISMRKKVTEEMKGERNLSMTESPTEEKTLTRDQAQRNVHKSTSPNFHGSPLGRSAEPSSIPSCSAPLNSSRTTLSISKHPIEASQIRPNVQSSLRSNGLLSWQGRQSTLILCSLLSIPLQSTKFRLTKYLKGLLSDSPKTCPTPPNQRESLATRMNGPQPGTPTLKRSSLLSHIDTGSSPSINNTCPLSSGQLHSPSMVVSSSSTKPSEIELAGVETSSSQKQTSSEISNACTSPPLAWHTKNSRRGTLSPSLRGELVTVHKALMPAGGGTQEFALCQMVNVTTNMCARVAREDTESPLALGEFE